jgi:hypothetical protein
VICHILLDFVYLWKQFPNFSSGRHMFCMANICKFQTGGGKTTLLVQ